MPTKWVYSTFQKESIFAEASCPYAFTWSSLHPPSWHPPVHVAIKKLNFMSEIAWPPRRFEQDQRARGQDRLSHPLRLVLHHGEESGDLALDERRQHR